MLKRRPFWIPHKSDADDIRCVCERASNSHCSTAVLLKYAPTHIYTFTRSHSQSANRFNIPFDTWRVILSYFRDESFEPRKYCYIVILKTLFHCHVCIGVWSQLYNTVWKEMRLRLGSGRSHNALWLKTGSVTSRAGSGKNKCHYETLPLPPSLHFSSPRADRHHAYQHAGMKSEIREVWLGYIGYCFLFVRMTLVTDLGCGLM